MTQPGNGAREALRSLIAEFNVVSVKNYEAATDVFLKELWERGFKIVPIGADAEIAGEAK